MNRRALLRSLAVATGVAFTPAVADVDAETGVPLPSIAEGVPFCRECDGWPMFGPRIDEHHAAVRFGDTRRGDVWLDGVKQPNVYEAYGTGDDRGWAIVDRRSADGSPPWPRCSRCAVLPTYKVRRGNYRVVWLRSEFAEIARATAASTAMQDGWYTANPPAPQCWNGATESEET